MSQLSEWVVKDEDDCIRIDGDMVNWLMADRMAVRCIERRTAIPEHFSYSFDVSFLGGFVEDEENRGLIRLWEVRSDWENRTWIYARKSGQSWTIYMEQLDEAFKVIEYEGSSSLQFGSVYNIQVIRDGPVYRLLVRDLDGTIVEDSKNISGSSGWYDRIWLASTIKSRRNRGNWSTGFIRDFKEISVTDS